MNKTEQATVALINTHPLSNRGHAFVVLKDAGLSGSGRVFNAAVKKYEEHFDLQLGKSTAAKRDKRDKDLRAVAHQTSANDVLEHINEIDVADALFWAFWKAFKYEGKWSKSLQVKDFAVHFKS